VEGVHPAGAVNDTKVVFAGTVSDNETFAAGVLPLLVTLIEYVMSEPAVTGSGRSVLVTERSGTLLTVPAVEALLLARFGSVEVVLTDAVFVMIDPPGAAAFTVTVMLNVADAPEAKEAIVQLMVPVPPKGGFVQLKAGPPTCAVETKVVPAGTGSLRTTVCASPGPALFTTTV
jgi:hypothetical protein